MKKLVPRTWGTRLAPDGKMPASLGQASDRDCITDRWSAREFEEGGGREIEPARVRSEDARRSEMGVAGWRLLIARPPAGTESCAVSSVDSERRRDGSGREGEKGKTHTRKKWETGPQLPAVQRGGRTDIYRVG